MKKKLISFFKNCRSKNQRSIFILLGHEGIRKVPVLWKLIRGGTAPVWFSDGGSSSRKVDWSSIGLGDSNEEVCIPEVTDIIFSDIQNSPIKTCHFAVVEGMESIRPSDLMSIVESVHGKGILVFIFSKTKDINHLTSPKVCDLSASLFMKRLFATFTSCSNCLILDGNLNILLAPKQGSDHMDTEENTCEVPIVSFGDEDECHEIFYKLNKLCTTVDQSIFLSQCLDALRKRTIHCTITASSMKGRGKSVVLGLAIAGAIALKYSNIFISSLCYDNVKTIFKYLLLGLDAMEFKEDDDYDLIQSVNPKFDNALLGLNIFRDHPQAVRFIFPGDVDNKLEQAELVVINEASAMPLPLLKKLIGPYIVLMASTTEGCGGSGKYLYEKTISEICNSPSLKKQDKTVSLQSLFPTSETSSWKKVSLLEPINYSKGDEVERWINHALCLECCVPDIQCCPNPDSCRLFYVSKETLFSYESYAERFLQQLMSLFFSIKRTVLPDILLKIAEKDYHIFCLLPPSDRTGKGNNDILCAILVHTEKRIPIDVVYSGINQLESFQECFNEWTSSSKSLLDDFHEMKGIHIVDIVTYPSYTKMGYGSRAVRLLHEFFDGKWIPLDDKPYIYSMKTKKYICDASQPWPPLLLQLTEVEPENIDYILVSYFLTPDLLRFWKKVEFISIHLTAKKNSAQEHLCLMMRAVGDEVLVHVKESWRSFCEYYFVLLSSNLKYFPSDFALNLLNCKFGKQLPKQALSKEDIDTYLKPQRMKALEKYCQNLGDLHCIMPCIPILAKLFFRHRFVGIDMPVAQQVILLAFGMQHKTIEDIASDLSLHTTQVHGLLNRTIRKLTTYLASIIEKAVEKTIAVRSVNMEPVSQTLDDELEEAAQKIKQKQLEDLKKLKEMDFSEYAIKGSEDDWEKALHSGRKTLVSIKSLKKAPEDNGEELPSREKNRTFKHKKKDMKRKR